MGLFDDLVPGKKAAPAAKSGLFDDLLPASDAPDYTDALTRSDGGLGQSLLRGIVGRGPDIVANMLELPATANEALIRATGAEPSETGVFAGMRGLWRSGADAVRDLGYSKEMDAVGYGAPRASGADAVAAVNPMSGMGLGERLSTVGKFVPDTLAGSAMDMVAMFNPLTLGGYVASRTEEVAKNRAANDKRENVSLGDLAIAAPAAAIEALLERYTTMRLLPQGTTIATPGAVDATIRIAKELGFQGTTGGIEEVIPYLAETAGTQTGTTGTGALESFVGGALAEGALGATVQTAKEVAKESAALRSPAPVETALDEETFAGGTTFADLIPPKPPITPPQQPVQQDAPVAPAPAPVREPAAPVQEATPAASIFTHEKDGSTGKSKITYSTEERSDGSRALVRNIVYEDGETFTAYLNNDGEWSKGLPARTAGSGGAFAQTGNTPQSFPSDEAALVAAKEDAGVVSEPESPAPDANLFADYDPAENQTVRRSEGNLSFPENKLTRRAVDDALSDPDPVAGAERLLLNVAAQPDASTAEKWLAEKLAPMMRALGIKLAPADPNYKYGGGFNNVDNTVWVRQANPEVVLHENLHGVTSALITNKAARSNPVVGKAVTELEDMRGFLQGQLSLGDVNISSLSPDVQTVLNDPQGPLSNAKEFVTYGMTNRPFQDFLKSLPPPPGRTEARNMWEFFKQTVTSLFGKVTASQRSFLDALIESSADLVEFAAANPKVVKMAQKAEAAKLTPVAELPSTPPKPAVQSPPAPPSPASPQGADSPPVETARAVPPAAPAKPATEIPPSRPLTSTKNAMVEGDREARGKEPIERDAPRSDEATLEMAKAAIADNPDLPAELIARLSVSGVSSINSIEESVLLIESERLRAARDRAAERAADPDLSDDARATAAAKFDELEMQIDAIDQATANSGREWGRWGRARQQMLKDDFSLAALERKARKVKGAPLTREEQAEIKAMAETIAKQQAELDAVRKQLADFETGAAVEQTYKRLLEDIKKSARIPADVAALKKKADAAKAALRELAGTDAATMVDAATLSPEQALLDLGKYHYANGAQDIDAWTAVMEADVPEQFRKGLADLFELSKLGAAKPVLEGPLTHKQVYDLALANVRSGVKGEDAVMAAVTKDVQAEHPGTTERDVRRLFSEYGKAYFPSKDADKTALRELRALVQMQESIDRLEEGLPKLKNGLQRDKATADVIAKRAELNALLKAQAKKTTEAERKAAIEAARVENLRKQIELIDRQIMTGERDAKAEKKPVSAEVERLSALRDTLRAEQKAIDNPPKSEQQKREEARVRGLESAIKDMRDALAGKPADPAKPLATNDQIKALEKLRDELRAQLDATKAAKNPPMSDAEKQQRRIESGLKRRIKNVEDLLIFGKKPKPDAVVKGETALLLEKALEAFTDIRDAIDARDNPPLTAEQKYQKSRATGIANQIKKIQERIAANDYEKAIRIPKTLDEANKKIAFDLAKLKWEFARKQWEIQQSKRSPSKKALDSVVNFAGLARSIFLSIDLGFTGLQMGMYTAGHPIKAFRVLRRAIKSGMSEVEFHAATERLKNRKNADAQRRAGLPIINDMEYKLGKMEEQYMSTLIDKLPSGLKGSAVGAAIGAVQGGPVGAVAGAALGYKGKDLIKASNRAMVSALNEVRAQMFDTLYDTRGPGREFDKPELEKVGRAIGDLTGRAGGNKYAEAAGVLNGLLLAPRWMFSRFKTVLGAPLYGEGSTARTRKHFAKEYARALAGWSTLTTAAFLSWLAFDDDEDKKEDIDDKFKKFMQLDPLKSGFGDMRFGKIHVNATAGLGSVITFLSRVLAGQYTTSKGDKRALRDNYTLDELEDTSFTSKSMDAVFSDFAKGRLSPPASYIYSAMSGKSFDGPFDPLRDALKYFSPLTSQGLKDELEIAGVPFAVPLLVAKIFGGNVGVREASAFEPDYKNLSREEKDVYSGYMEAANKVKKSRDELQEYANSLPASMSPYDMRAAVETKADELGLDGVSAGIYKRNTTAKDKETGRKKRGVKRNETGAVELDYSDSDTYKAFAASEKEIGKLDKSIEKIQDGALTEMEKEKLWSSYQSSDYKSEDDLLRILRQERTYQQELYLGYGNED